MQLPIMVRPYWTLRDRLSVYDGLVLCGHRVVVPSSLRQKVLKDLLLMHQGIRKMGERAKISFYCPGIYADIERVAMSCIPCQSRFPSQQKESFVAREPASRAFEAVHIDFFHFGGKQFLVN